MAIADPRALLLKSNDLYGNSGTLIDVTVESAGWEYTGLRVIRLASGEAYMQSTGQVEVALVPLAVRIPMPAGAGPGMKSVLAGVYAIVPAALAGFLAWRATAGA